MRHSAWVLAYHGCDREVGEAILSGEKEIRPSENDYDWLGEGAYFWENSYSRALAWADFVKKNPASSKTRINEPFVIGAIIDPGNCLDLSEAECLEILKAAYVKFKELMDMVDLPLPKNEAGFSTDKDLIKRKLDCAVVNYLHTRRGGLKEPEFDTLRAPFMEGGSLYEGSNFHSKTHVQWCIRQPQKNIFAYFRPRLPHTT